MAQPPLPLVENEKVVDRVRGPEQQAIVKRYTEKAVQFIREKREQNLTLPLPERKDSGGMQEESFDAPEFDAEVTVNWAKLKDEMAQLKPQLQFAFQESRARWLYTGITRAAKRLSVVV